MTNTYLTESNIFLRETVLMDLISIVIPIYNTGVPLRDCLDSVLAQTYTNLEVILVDDHSTEPLTLEILKEYAQKDPRIKLTLNPENHGVSYCRNIGINQCPGKFLSFLDSDDQFVPDFVERMHDALVENDTDFAVCNVKQFAIDPSIHLESDFIFPYTESDLVETATFIKQNKLFHMPITSCAKLINTNKLRQAQLYFVDNLRYAEDQDWCFRLFLSQKSFSVLDFFGVNRLLTGSSLTHNVTEREKKSDLLSLELKYKALKDYGFLSVCGKDFFDHGSAVLSSCLFFTEDQEIQQGLLLDARERFSRMGVDFKVNPNQFDYWSCWLLYQAKRIFFVQDIKHRAKYKIYKKILRSKQQSS